MAAKTPTKPKTDTPPAVVAHPSIPGVTSESHPHVYNAAEGVWFTPETKPSAFRKDGTPTKYIDRAALLANRGPVRPIEERIAEVEARIVKAKERHVKELAGMQKTLDNLKNGGGRGGRAPVDPAVAEAAAREMLAGGMTPQAIIDLEAKLRAAKAFVAGKSAEELAALTAPQAPAVPSFLAPTGEGGNPPQA